MTTIYTLLCDGREDANRILVTTTDEALALKTAETYIINKNVGEGDFWSDTAEFEKWIVKNDSTRRDSILYCCNNAWLDSPTFVEYKLDDIDEDGLK